MMVRKNLILGGRTLLMVVSVLLICGVSVEAKSADGKIKVAFICGQELVEGAEVELLDESMEVTATETSSSGGKAVFNEVSQGTYYYQVVSLPEGYKCDTSQQKVSIVSDGLEIRKVVKLKADFSSVKKEEKNLSLTTESDLRELSNLSAEDYDLMFEGTPLENTGEAFVEAEEEFGVNGLYLVGLCCVESTYDGIPGNSKYARERNNLTGWGAFDSNPDGAYYFDSKSECISHVAERLAVNYLTEDGKFFSGYTPKAVDVKYCSDPEHADKIVSCAMARLEQAGIN